MIVAHHAPFSHEANTIRQILAHHDPRTLADMFESKHMQWVAPLFKEKLYAAVGSPASYRPAGNAAVYALTHIDNNHVGIGGWLGGGVLNLKTNTLDTSFGHRGDNRVVSMAHCNSGEHILLYNDGGIDCIDQAGNSTKKFHLGNNMWKLLALDSRILATSINQYKIHVWDTAQEKELPSFDGHTASILTLLPINASHIASGSADKTVRIWDSNTGKEIQTLYHGDLAWSLMRLGEDYLASFGNFIKIWDLAKGFTVNETVGNEYSLVSCECANNTRGSNAQIAKVSEFIPAIDGMEMPAAVATTPSLNQLFKALRSIDSIQTVIPLDAHHLIAVYRHQTER